MFRTIALAAIASLALTGCIKHEPYGHHTEPGPDNGGHHGGNTEEKVVLNERSDWSIRYVNRTVWEEDGADVEHFKTSYKGNNYYIIRLVRPDDFKDAYKSDAAAFFTYEAKCLLEKAQNENKNFWDYPTDVYTQLITDIYLNRLRSGTWIAFMFELDSKCNVTGNYAETTFTLQEQEATGSFSKWLGDWRVSNGLVGYDIKISSIDNNFIYKIEGWECGPAVSFQMNMEYLEGEFWAPNGNLYISSQYLGTYDDEDFGHGTVDELFMGNIFDSQGLTLLTDEGLDVAVMVYQDDDNAELQGAEVKINTDSGEYITKFHSMQYYMWAHNDSKWYPYNSNVAALPLAMTRLAGTRAADVTPSKERTATKASIHHGQPKAAQGGRNNVAKKAVRMK